MKTHIYMAPILKNSKSTQKPLKIKSGKIAYILKYFIEFISRNILQKAKQILNSQFSILNYIGLGTDLVRSCYIHNNKIEKGKKQMVMIKYLKIAAIAIAIILLTANSNTASAQTVAAERVSIIFVKLSIA